MIDQQTSVPANVSRQRGFYLLMTQALGLTKARGNQLWTPIYFETHPFLLPFPDDFGAVEKNENFERTVRFVGCPDISDSVKAFAGVLAEELVVSYDRRPLSYLRVIRAAAAAVVTEMGEQWRYYFEVGLPHGALLTWGGNNFSGGGAAATAQMDALFDFLNYTWRTGVCRLVTIQWSQAEVARQRIIAAIKRGGEQ